MARAGIRDIWRPRLIRLLRVVLPLGALVLLSTVFLVSRSVDPGRAVELAGIDVAELTREPRIGQAQFATVMDDATELVILARSVRSTTDLAAGGPIGLQLQDPDGEIRFNAGRSAVFSARDAEIDQARDQLVMRDQVRLETSDGYELLMPELIAALSHANMIGLGGIRGQGPLGTLEADMVTLSSAQGETGGYRLAFTGNVRLIYLPIE